MKWFKSPNIEPLEVSMPGVKLGDRLLVIGCSDPILIARLAVKSGLTGRACAVDDSDALATEAAVVARREGALIETERAPGWRVPYDNGAFDVVVLRDVLSSGSARAAAATESRRVLRPGGRCIAIDGAPRRGLGALLGGRQAAALDADAATRALTSAGFVAVRPLAEREGMLFVEGVRGNA